MPLNDVWLTQDSPSAAALAEHGLFHNELSGFNPRQAQREMAARVEQALTDNEVLVTESGTGTGKTFAYLVPALLSGKRVIISTGTKHLQEQLFFRDLPQVCRILGTSGRHALLKGRANYLCRYRLDLAQSQIPLQQKEFTENLNQIVEWSIRTKDGDIAEVNQVPGDASIWPAVTSTVENCLGSKCPVYERCFVNRARRNALSADVLVVNHHLFFSDLVLKEKGFGQLLPGHDAVIFDEAHQLPEIASTYLGITLSTRQLLDLGRDTRAAEGREKSASPDLEKYAHELEITASQLNSKLNKDQRGSMVELEAIHAVNNTFDEIQTNLFALANALEVAAPAGDELEKCWQRALLFCERLETLLQAQSDTQIRWFEKSGNNLRLHCTPVEMGERLQAFLDPQRHALVFTSATLAVDDDFSLFCRTMALSDVQTASWVSPYDYAHQTLLYLPDNMPEPRLPDFNEHVVAVAERVLEITRGRAFLLFTSHRALQNAAKLLKYKVDFPLLVQGESPKSELLDRFRDLGNAVLLGTASFWEGVDVPGEALSCVLIDKLPFAAPTEPVLQARLKAMEQQGLNPFKVHQIPQAVITLKQGVGRLIRDENDRGLVVICDPRIMSKGYGRQFIKSLPPIPITREINQVSTFFS